MNRAARQFAVGIAALMAAGGASAQAWPAKSVRIIVPFGAGGGSDIQARLLSKKFYESMGQTFVVDNRPGAAGLIGAEITSKSPPDGYTMMLTSASLSVNVSLYKKVPLDPLKDLAPVSWVSSAPLVLTVHPSVPVKNLKEFIALGKKSGGRLNAGHNGSGTTSHLALEMLKQAAGFTYAQIPYKGGGPATTAILSGETDFIFGTALAVKPHVLTGKLRGLAVTTLKPSSAFKDLPTMASIFPGFDADNWYAIFFPAGTPREIIAKTSAEVKKALTSPDIVDFMSKEGADPVGSTPEELAAYFRKEVEKYGKVIRAGNIQAD